MQAQADQEQQQKQDGTEASSAACDIKGHRDLDCEVCGAAGEGLVHFTQAHWVQGAAGVTPIELPLHACGAVKCRHTKAGNTPAAL
jgi:hypothetical protein